MKTAVVYYSLEGNTAFAARALAEALGADLIELKPVVPYPTGKAVKFYAGGKSSVLKEAPALEPVNFPADCDTVIIGTPLWAWDVTPPIRTFLQEHDLTGRQVAAFVCSGGGKPDRAFESIRTGSHSERLLDTRVFVNALKNRAKTAETVAALAASIRDGASS